MNRNRTLFLLVLSLVDALCGIYIALSDNAINEYKADKLAHSVIMAFGILARKYKVENIKDNTLLAMMYLHSDSLERISYLIDYLIEFMRDRLYKYLIEYNIFSE